MSDEAAFLSAIRDNPADDTARLAYADWLDEHGQPERAEFIRLRHQFAQLKARLNDLGTQLDPVWLVALTSRRVRVQDITRPEILTLRSGRPVRLRELRQWEVHEWWIDGLPTAYTNRHLVDTLISDVERERPTGRPHLIPPEERPILGFPEWFLDGRDPPVALPPIGCVGRFTSARVSPGDSLDYSQLVVVWFQDEFAFPIDPAVRERIRAIDWEAHATDFDR